MKISSSERRNHRALGDIGYFYDSLRGFGAQLLENNKKEACAGVARPPPPPVADGVFSVTERVGQMIISAKTKPEEDIEMSSEREVKKDKEEDSNSGKKSRAFTSVLTARSKAACGVTNKPKVEIVDIDAGDVGNDLAAVEYVEDIYNFYKEVENESRHHHYMNTQHQPEIKKRMRKVLVDWLMDVHSKFDLSLETLYLTINIIDRFLAVKPVPKRVLQLVGVSAMLIASKYEEIWAPQVNEFVFLSDRAYTHEQILGMEKIKLGTLEWNLTVPTPFVFLVRFIKASIPDMMLENMAHFLCELGMMHYVTLVKYCPSMVAASAVFAARCTLNKSPVWNETLKLHTGYSQEQLRDCARLLVKFHSTVGNGKHKVVHRIYSDPQRGAVAILPPAKSLLLKGCTSI
ncbi:G2/mitotic-specific cyclin S13-7-like [Gastrolobium bilobum]|uniref:G2/mitotic-specific cyclin S13-7-like n=1 Tax=Gastrolobium bilobum TaxID=150636 RepID=UPI002AB090FA|nr:G2/mitotic-specific cyclin S13-7-like [Gastrolobium bilobum]